MNLDRWTTIGGLLTLIGALSIGMTSLTVLPGCEDLDGNDPGDQIGDAWDDAADGVDDAADNVGDAID